MSISSQITNDKLVMPAPKERLQIKHLLSSSQVKSADDGRDVVWGLTQPQKTLSPRYFYDAKGSQLFEQICMLPEYYLTRTETAILEQCASEIAQLTGGCELIELGSGSATKTRLLLNAYQEQDLPLCYLPIDVSASILEESALQLLQDYPSLQIQGLVSTYELALQQLTPSPLSARLMIFLGSTLGNFSQADCDRFFSQVVAALATGDYFLLGIDLQKSVEVLEAAYNDNQGVTATFNLNILQHLNKRFAGNFDLDLFKHKAFYNTAKSQIEMHLISQRSHSACLKSLNLNLTFNQDETILTEISRKFDWQQMHDYFLQRGLKPVRGWIDSRYPFGVLLSQKQ